LLASPAAFQIAPGGEGLLNWRQDGLRWRLFLLLSKKLHFRPPWKVDKKWHSHPTPC